MKVPAEAGGTGADNVGYALAMEAIADEGAGVIVLINRPMQGAIGRSIELRGQGKGAGDFEVEELRDYGAGAQILTELGVHDMILLTNTHHAFAGLEGYGLSIVDERPIPVANA